MNTVIIGQAAVKTCSYWNIEKAPDDETDGTSCRENVQLLEQNGLPRVVPIRTSCRENVQLLELHGAHRA